MAHIHEKVDFTVEVLVIYNNKVLLRHHDKYYIRLSVWWHIELDEDQVQAAYREVIEEVWLEINIIAPHQFAAQQYDNFTELIPPFFLNRHRINDTHEHVTMTYIATSDSDQITIWAWESQVPCKWFTVEELQDPKYSLISSLITNAEYAINFVTNLS